MLDLAAPILPGVGAAGLKLGDDVARVLALRAPDSTARQPGTELTRHDFGPVSVWEARGRIEQVRVSEGYRGVLDGAIGIGSTIADVERHFGKPVEEDEEDNLIVHSMDGWSFETEPWSSPSGTAQANSSARITEVYVHSPARGP